jgi:cytochrome c-type biogenesis protein CcmH
VAQSSAPTAQAVRQAVSARVAQGQSDAAIEDFLVSRYGPGILLRPPVRGGAGLVWLLPVAAVTAGLVGLATFFWRRRRLVPPEVADEDRALVDDALARTGRL